MHKFILLVGLALMFSACTTIKSGSTCAVDTSYFTENNTLAWSADFAKISNDPLQAIGPVMLEQLKAEIENQFEALGYTFTDQPEAADMLVSFVVATRQEVVKGSYAYIDPYCWGQYRRPEFISTRDHIAKEAFLAIDLTEVKNKLPIWRGWAEKSVTPSDRSDPDPLMQSAVTSILENLPGR